MITKKQAARENAKLYDHDSQKELLFLKGIEFAEQWIDVKDELPEIIDNKQSETVYTVQYKDGLWFAHNIGWRSKDYFSGKISWIIKVVGEVEKEDEPTHWRPINRK